MAIGNSLRQFRDLILNNLLVTFLSVALFAFIITTIALASSNQSKKEAIGHCNAQIWDATMLPRCSVAIATDIPENDPVYLKVDGTSYKLWVPHGSSLVWNTSTEQTAVLCSGTGNILEQTNQILSQKTCSRGTQFTVAGTLVSAKDLKCKNAITGEHVATGEQCGNGRGAMERIGFNAIANGFLTYIESCFNSERSSVLYTRHVLPGAAIKSAVTGVSNIPWQKGGMAETVNPDVSYTQAQQVVQFTNLLGSKEQAEKYLTEQQYLMIGHMTPQGDGIFHSWKRTSFFYTNAVPQWKTVNAGNWNRVELLSRSIASLLEEDLVVIQGSSGVLSLPHLNGENVAISLESSGIDVPLWTWKIVKSPSLDAGIAFVTLNNPYATKLDDSQLLCKNTCVQTGWSANEFANFKNGFTICCDPNDLIRQVPHSPDEGLVRTMLTRQMVPSGTGTSSGCFKVILALAVAQILRLKVF